MISYWLQSTDERGNLAVVCLFTTVKQQSKLAKYECKTCLKYIQQCHISLLPVLAYYPII